MNIFENLFFITLPSKPDGGHLIFSTTFVPTGAQSASLSPQHMTHVLCDMTAGDQK